MATAVQGFGVLRHGVICVLKRGVRGQTVLYGSTTAVAKYTPEASSRPEPVLPPYMFHVLQWWKKYFLSVRIFNRNSVRTHQLNPNVNLRKWEMCDTHERHVHGGHVERFKSTLRHAISGRIVTCLVGTLYISNVICDTSASQYFGT